MTKSNFFASLVGINAAMFLFFAFTGDVFGIVLSAANIVFCSFWMSYYNHG